MYWQSPSCGIFDTYDVQGWDPRCSQVRARGGRAQRDGRGGAEGSPLVLGTPHVPGKDLGFQKDVKKPCQCVLLWNCSRQHWEAGDIFGLEHPCSRRILLLVWFTTTRAKNPGGWAGCVINKYSPLCQCFSLCPCLGLLCSPGSPSLALTSQADLSLHAQPCQDQPQQLEFVSL